MNAKEIVRYEPDQTDLDALDIDTLARLANQEHRLVNEAVDEALAHMASGLQHAIRCGELLSALKPKVTVSNVWVEWIRENLDVSPTTASYYVRVFLYREQIPTTALTFRAAIAHLRGLPAAGSQRGRGRSYPDEVVEEAVRLRAEGVPTARIAENLGCSQTAVMLWSDPKQRERNRRNAARHNREKQAALKAKRRADSIAAAGGSIKKSHDLVLRLTRELDAALRNTTDTEMKDALRSAYSAATRSEAEILRALKIQ